MAIQALDSRTLVRLRRLPIELRSAQTTSLARAAFAAKRSIQHQSGYADRLSGVGQRGARLNVRYDIKGHGLNAAALIRATGPFHLLERDTKPHEIRPKGRRSGKLAALGFRPPRAISTPYGPRQRVQHPGTTGKHPFEKGVNAALPIIRRELADSFAGAIRRALR